MAAKRGGRRRRVMNRAMRLPVWVIVCAALLSFSGTSYAWHWTPPTSTNYWETVWGYITGFTPLAAGNEVAAFSRADNTIVGMTTVSWNGSSFGYNMVVFGPDASPIDVYFLVWDGSAELMAKPDFTSNPEEFGAGPTQHDLHAVPEPNVAAMFAVAMLVVAGLVAAQRRAACPAGRRGGA
jgi:hypothetical protein